MRTHGRADERQANASVADALTECDDACGVGGWAEKRSDRD